MLIFKKRQAQRHDGPRTRGRLSPAAVWRYVRRRFFSVDDPPPPTANPRTYLPLRGLANHREPLAGLAAARDPLKGLANHRERLKGKH